MYSRAKVGKIGFKYLAVLFFSSQILIVVFIIASLSTKNWLNLDTDETIAYIGDEDAYYYYFYFFKSSEFIGGIVNCHEGCGRSDTYSSLSDTYCSQYISANEYDTLCSTFKRLSTAGNLKIAFDAVTLFCVLCWALFMLIRFKDWKLFKVSYVCSTLSCVFYYLGSILWFAISSASFNNCNEFPSDGSLLIVCATDGPGLVLFLMVFYPIILTVYLILAYKAKKSLDAVENPNHGQGMELVINPQNPIPMINAPVNPQGYILVNQPIIADHPNILPPQYMIGDPPNILPPQHNIYPPEYLVYNNVNPANDGNNINYVNAPNQDIHNDGYIVNAGYGPGG